MQQGVPPILDAEATADTEATMLSSVRDTLCAGKLDARSSATLERATYATRAAGDAVIRGSGLRTNSESWRIMARSCWIDQSMPHPRASMPDIPCLWWQSRTDDYRAGGEDLGRKLSDDSPLRRLRSEGIDR